MKGSYFKFQTNFSSFVEVFEWKEEYQRMVDLSLPLTFKWNRVNLMENSHRDELNEKEGELINLFCFRKLNFLDYVLCRICLASIKQ